MPKKIVSPQEYEFAKPGRPKLNKITISIRLEPDTLLRVREKTVLTGNLSLWIEQAIWRRLESKE